MGYRAILESSHESVQDLEISAVRRLDEAVDLFFANRYHTCIYLAGLAAEMYLKTACFFLGGARPGDSTAALLGAVRHGKHKPPFRSGFESGHGLWFWSQELMARRNRRGLSPAPNRYRRIIAALYVDWYIGVRYRPGCASEEDAERFLECVEWLANNHAVLRR